MQMHDGVGLRANINTGVFVPAQEVVAELLASPMPREARAFLAAASVETLLPSMNDGPLAWPFSWSPFRCLFGFVEWTGSLASFPAWPGDSTHNTHAAGVWQDQPSTYADMAAFTGNTGFTPQDQIGNNWALAVHDYGKRTNGGDLLAALKAEQVDRVSPALITTWPEGCDANFPARYAHALALFPADGPPPPPVADLSIPLGLEFTCPIAGSVMGHGIPVPADALQSSDVSICRVSIADPKVTLAGLGLGTVHVKGADKDLLVAVVAAQPDHLEVDLSHGTFAMIAAATKGISARLPMLAMAGALLLSATMPAGHPTDMDQPAAAAIPEIRPVAEPTDFHFPALPLAVVGLESLCRPLDLRWLLIPSPCNPVLP
jgi:hypothetical protein